MNDYILRSKECLPSSVRRSASTKNHGFTSLRIALIHSRRWSFASLVKDHQIYASLRRQSSGYESKGRSTVLHLIAVEMAAKIAKEPKLSMQMLANANCQHERFARFDARRLSATQNAPVCHRLCLFWFAFGFYEPPEPV